MILDRDCLTILKKIISKKLDEQDAISLHATRPTLMRTQVPIGSTIMGPQIPKPKITGIQIQVLQ